MNVRGDGVVPPPRIGAGNLAMRYSRACLVALLLGLSFALGCASAHAASLDEALAHFTTDDFSDTNDGIEAVAASGSPRAEAIIRALQDGQLMFSAERKAVYIQDDAGITRRVPLPNHAGTVEFRGAIVNLNDRTYLVRNGTGIGVFANQFGPRRAVYGGIKWELPFTKPATAVQ